MNKLTVIIPTFNEENNIAKAIKSVSFADEIIVIDSHSCDNTKLIAQKYNVTFIERKFDDFSSQKNYAISKASHSWILILDADEYINDSLKNEITSILENDIDVAAFCVYRTYYFKETKINFSGVGKDKVIRLFNKNYCTYVGKVHEKVKVNGKTKLLKGKLSHHSYKNWNQYKNKLIFYAKLQAKELIDKNASTTFFHLYCKPLIRFFTHFFIQLGFLDGKNGFIISYLHAYGVYKRYIELIKLKNKNIVIKTDVFKIGYDAKRFFHNKTGLGNYSRDLVKILAAFYPKNQYVLFNPKPKKIDRVPIENNLTEIIPVSKFWKKFSSIWRLKPIVNQIKKQNIQLYHGLSGEIPLGIKKLNIKTVVTIHDLIFVRYPKLYSYFDRHIHFLKFKYAAKKADKIVAISNQTKNDIVEFLKIAPSKIEVIYQGCHQIFKEEQSIEYKNTIQKKYNLPNHFILNVGTIEPRKNVLTVVKAIKNIDTTLVIIGGKTPYYKEIVSYIKLHQLENKVFFLEGVDLKELATIYQLATVFVYPSIFEGFGIPIIEALFSKTPVITTNSGVFPEAGGPNSVYINPTNENEIAKQIDLLLNNTELREKIASKGFEYAQKFNDSSIATAYMDLYRKVINNDDF